MARIQLKNIVKTWGTAVGVKRMSLDIADGGAASAVAPLLHEVEAATARATTLYAHIRSFGAPGD